MTQPLWTNEKIESEVRKLEQYIDRTEIDGDLAIELMKQMRDDYEQGLTDVSGQVAAIDKKLDDLISMIASATGHNK